MCEPVTLAIAATAVAAAGTAVKTINTMNRATYEARVADSNAKLASAQAADAAERGKLEAQRVMGRNSQLLGRQRAAAAANGIEVDFGSSADVQQDVAEIGRQEVATTYQNAEREGLGFDISASNYQAKAAGARAARGAALIEGAFDFGSTILGGVQQVGKIKASQKAASFGA